MKRCRAVSLFSVKEFAGRSLGMFPGGHVKAVIRGGYLHQKPVLIVDMPLSAIIMSRYGECV